jgi:hypothetical protein
MMKYSRISGSARSALYSSLILAALGVVTAAWAQPMSFKAPIH